MESTLRHCGSIVVRNSVIADSFDKLLHSISRVRYRVRTLGFGVFPKRPVNLAHDSSLENSGRERFFFLRSIKADENGPEAVKEISKIVYIFMLSKIVAPNSIGQSTSRTTGRVSFSLHTPRKISGFTV